jgi:hypothetical protein
MKKTATFGTYTLWANRTGNIVKIFSNVTDVFEESKICSKMEKLRVQSRSLVPLNSSVNFYDHENDNIRNIMN